MQAIKGYLDNGKFTPHEVVNLPRRAEVTLIFREIVQPQMPDDEKAFWIEFDSMTASSMNENDLLNDDAFSRRESGRDLAAFIDGTQT